MQIGRLVTIIVTIAGAPIPADAAQDRVPTAVAPEHPYAIHVAEAARRFGLPEGWIWAVMHAESRGYPRAISPVGAMGLMQIMPTTWATLTARYALGSDPYDARANIHAGAAYLREMFDRYRDLGTALAAYNAGPGRIEDWRAGARPLPGATLAYVQRIASEVDGPAFVAAAATPLAPPITWRTAALFTAHGDGASADNTAAVSVQPISDTPASAPPLSAQPRSPANPLFIARSGQGAP